MKVLDFVFDMGVVASEDIVAEGIELALLLDVILVVLPTNCFDSGEDVDDAHFSSPKEKTDVGGGGFCFLSTFPVFLFP